MRYPPKVAILDSYESIATLCIFKMLGGCANSVYREIELGGRAWLEVAEIEVHRWWGFGLELPACPPLELEDSCGSG